MRIIRAKKVSLSMDLAPLIDVVFQLLVFFMLTSTFANPSMKLILPKAVTEDSVKHEYTVIAIDGSGKVLVNEKESNLSRLEDDLRMALSLRNDKAVHIKGDQEMPYKYFVEVMDHARKAGASQINVVHKRK